LAGKKYNKIMKIYKITNKINGKTYRSVQEAAQDIESTTGNIAKTIRGKHKSCKGFTFKYLEINSDTNII
jgi:hypothetical protein